MEFTVNEFMKREFEIPPNNKTLSMHANAARCDLPSPKMKQFGLYAMP